MQLSKTRRARPINNPKQKVLSALFRSQCNQVKSPAAWFQRDRAAPPSLQGSFSSDAIARIQDHLGLQCYFEANQHCFNNFRLDSQDITPPSQIPWRMHSTIRKHTTTNRIDQTGSHCKERSKNCNRANNKSMPIFQLVANANCYFSSNSVRTTAYSFHQSSK